MRICMIQCLTNFFLFDKFVQPVKCFNNKEKKEFFLNNKKLKIATTNYSNIKI